ncbi:hypothetical protein K503DRAFT_774525 [Rhizopogon vinicolor AM-OR11-026]|uniref:Uncharacterized protein n=1 Tax=Rhizopogon vinicolor AM-OR11-026 TaxID=1314800 RepID=A0A1B7MPD9_9AGAM|nr:hypothetical protein K503DRAFT_774525 [Rhizopogon vinicolor AM-OR11-026]
MSYFTPPCNSNSNRRGQPQSTSYSTHPQPPSGGGYAQSTPPVRQGGFIPPPVGAMRTFGQTILQCSRCREILPPGKDHYTHLLGCGAAEILTKGFTPYEYPPRQNHPGHQR